MARSARIILVSLLLQVGAGAVAAFASTSAPRGAHAAVKHRKAVHHRRSPDSARPRPQPATVSLAPAAAPAGCADGDLVPAAANLDRIRTASFCLVNQQRAAQRLPLLRVDPVLQAAAQSHSADMVGQNYFDHVAPTGIGLLDRVLAAGYVVVAGVLDVAENIATGSGALATPSSTVAAWMASPGHRANILNRAYAAAGIGVVAASPALLGAGGCGATYTEDFGSG